MLNDVGSKCRQSAKESLLLLELVIVKVEDIVPQKLKAKKKSQIIFQSRTLERRGVHYCQGYLS